MNKYRFFLFFLVTLLFLSGLGVCLYPVFHGAFVDHTVNQNARDFLILAGPTDPTVPVQDTDTPDTDTTIPTVHEVTEPMPYPALYEDMVTYNASIYRNGQSGLSSSLAYETPSFILSEYGLTSEIFGVISIPRLEIELPIYLGASSPHINNGVAHMSQTSLPIGGNNTNSVIAGHRGWDGALFFRYITELEPGDLVIITNLWDTLTYSVSETKIIEPYQVEQILIQPDRELLTLLTCHPYASGGKQRYLVICERVPNE